MTLLYACYKTCVVVLVDFLGVVPAVSMTL